MGRGKRRASSGQAVAWPEQEIPLSDSPRSRRRAPVIPVFPSFQSPPLYAGDFENTISRIVGLHARGNYGLAGEIARGMLELELSWDADNEHDPNAVLCSLRLDDGSLQSVGYLDADDAPAVAKALRDGARLCGRPVGRPWSAGGSKGGSLDVEVSLADD